MDPVGSVSSPWPYPRWVAHRGAGRLAPENTLAAFRLGASHGYRMFECDVKLSADGVPFLLHDATLDRTTNGLGTAGEQPWSALGQLDAGGWHSSAFAGEPLPTLEAVAHYCQANGHSLNIEIKPTPGHEADTGRLVALAARALWGTGTPSDTVPPLLTSFRVEALAAAQAAAPELPRGLLLDRLWDGWLAQALALDCVAVVAHHPLWVDAAVAQARAAGLRTLAYTVNHPEEVQRLLALGVDGLITDRVDAFSPHS
ncbi:MAG: glycerophosphodiester phosphodiesterase [Polaromonas sp.]|nr:glycerophosphodiester phosphodiesterase [Polaromonas sp.]